MGKPKLLFDFDRFTVAEMIKKMQKGFSVLKTTKEGRELRKSFAKDDILVNIAFGIALWSGWRKLANLFHRRKLSNDEYRTILVKLFGWLVPYQELPANAGVSQSGKARIVITNHPSDNEVVIAGFWSIQNYPSAEIIYPVDLPRFEVLAKFYQKFLDINIKIVPLLPPGSMEFMGSPSEFQGLKKSLEKNYLEVVCHGLKTGATVVIAQQAEFQEYIFLDKTQYETGRTADGQKVRTPLGMLLISIGRCGAIDFNDIEIIPMAVEVPKRAKIRKLNVCIEYPTHIGQIWTATEWLKVMGGGDFHQVDFKLLRYMADDMEMPKRWIFPQNE